MKTIFQLFIISFLFGCNSPISSQSIYNDTEVKSLAERISIVDLNRSCYDTAVPQKMHIIGNLTDKDSNSFKVYTDYQTFPLAIRVRGCVKHYFTWTRIYFFL